MKLRAIFLSLWVTGAIAALLSLFFTAARGPVLTGMALLAIGSSLYLWRNQNASSRNPITGLEELPGLKKALRRGRLSIGRRSLVLILVQLETWNFTGDWDVLLKQTVRVLQGQLRLHDGLFQLRSDTLAIVVRLKEEAASSLAERLSISVNQELAGLLMDQGRVGVSFAVRPQDGDMPDELLECARQRIAGQELPLWARWHLLEPIAKDLLAEDQDFYRSVTFLNNLVEAKDPYTLGHSRRVTGYCLAVAGELGLNQDVLSTITRAAMLHDLGKLEVPLLVLTKTQPLTAEEWQIIRSHSTWSYEFLHQLPGMEHLADIVRSHHERWDGQGYPDRLTRDDIPLEARIIACCDALDAMTTYRVYRPARRLDSAIEELKRCSGTQFDPAVAKALIDALKRNPEDFLTAAATDIF